MHYAFPCAVAPANTSSNPLWSVFKLASGVVRRISIFFPPGCQGNVAARVYNSSTQVAPQNQDGYYALSGYTVDANVNILFNAANNVFYGKFITVDPSYTHILIVMFDVQESDDLTITDAIQNLGITIDKLIAFMQGYL